MSALATTTTDIVALLTVGAQLLSLLLIAALVWRSKLAAVSVIVARYALPAAFVVSLVASILTLVYSDVFGLAPCGLCWLQRVLLYPMPILLAIGMWAKDSGVAKYVLGLSIPGAIIAGYQHLLQVGMVGELPCPAAPGAADCAQRVIFEFGYVTFPLMAVTAFVLIGLLMMLKMRGSRVSAAS